MSDTIEISKIEIVKPGDEKIEQIKSKRKWKQIANKFHDPELENEEEEEENFVHNIKEGTKKYSKKLKQRYDEFGTEFTPFNMREEMDEGNIDDTGYFVYNRRNDIDPWYDSVKEDLKKKEFEKALKKDKINESASDEENQEENNKDNEDFQYYGEEDLYYKEEKISSEEIKQIKDEVKQFRIKLIDYLEGEETVQHALNRLKPKSKPSFKPQRKKQKIEDEEIYKEENEEKKQKFNELLNIVSKLTELSYFNVYSDTYAKIENAYGKFDIYIWKYRTISNTDADNKEITEYGPFTSSEIKSWITQGYLNDTDNLKFELKVINSKDSNKDTWIKKDDFFVKESLSL